MFDRATFVDDVREDNQTELSRLGSSKGLYAETDGEIDTEPVLEATAAAEHAAWETFDGWATDEANDSVQAFFEDVAAQERAHFETVCDRLGTGTDQPESTPSLHRYLRECEDTVERLGAFVGRVLASQASKDQVVGYFVGNADPQAADEFRGFGADLDDQLERATALLEEVIETEDGDDHDRARLAAAEAIEAAYDEYVESLEALGANPKPVC